MFLICSLLESIASHTLQGIFYERGTDYVFQVFGISIVTEGPIYVKTKHLNRKRNEDVNSIAFKESTLELIPNSLFKYFTNLESFECHKCKIENIHCSLGWTDKLLDLQISSNIITELQNFTFKGAENLKEIDLAANLISNIERFAFKGLKSLHTLTLAHNYISELHHELFTDLGNLKRLFIFGNKISCLHGQLFMNNRKLSTIDISENRVTYIDSDLLQNQRNIEKFNFKNNICTSFQYEDKNETNYKFLAELMESCFIQHNGTTSKVRNGFPGLPRKYANIIIFMALVIVVFHA